MFTCNSGKIINKTHFINISKKITIIGVKSIGQKVVGIIFFIIEYNGSIISATNFGLKFNQNNTNQDSITSKIIKYDIISNKIIIAINICI